MPDEAEVHGLAALMDIQASRLAARIDADGEPILLLDQDRGRWDRLLIRRGFAALTRAESLPGAFGPYTLQAAIAGKDPQRTAALFETCADVKETRCGFTATRHF